MSARLFGTPLPRLTPFATGFFPKSPIPDPQSDGRSGPGTRNRDTVSQVPVTQHIISSRLPSAPQILRKQGLHRRDTRFLVRRADTLSGPTIRRIHITWTRHRNVVMKSAIKPEIRKIPRQSGRIRPLRIPVRSNGRPDKIAQDLLTIMRFSGGFLPIGAIVRIVSQGVARHGGHGRAAADCGWFACGGAPQASGASERAGGCGMGFAMASPGLMV